MSANADIAGGHIIVETNYRVYAFTSSKVSRARLCGPLISLAVPCFRPAGRLSGGALFFPPPPPRTSVQLPVLSSLVPSPVNLHDHCFSLRWIDVDHHPRSLSSSHTRSKSPSWSSSADATASFQTCLWGR
jgi:hypothetical protein